MAEETNTPEETVTPPAKDAAATVAVEADEKSSEVTPKKPAQEAPKKEGDRSRGGNEGPRRGKGRRDGRKKREPKEFEESIIQIDRVTRVTKGGRQLRFRISIVIGDKKGRVGFGVAKSAEVMLGVQKAIAKAKRNIITVPIFEDTIPHAVSYKFKATKVLLFPAPEGKGVIAGGALRKVLELSGVKNVLSKMHGSRNSINAAYATIEALKSLQNRAPHKKKGTSVEAVEEEATVVKEEKTDSKEEKTEKKPAAKKAAPKKEKKEKPAVEKKPTAKKTTKKKDS